jgi:16S rRNA processing protein RimM
MLVVVGRVGRAHGIRGEVAVEVRTDEPERRLGPGAVLLTDPEPVGPLTVESGNVHSGRLLLAFAGVHDRTAAEALRGTMLLAEVDPDELPADDDEWYDHQLVGLSAVLPSGEPLGSVAEVLHLPGHELLVVTREGGPELLVPFVTGIVPTVDLAGGRVVVDPPPGLLGDEPPTDG